MNERSLEGKMGKIGVSGRLDGREETREDIGGEEEKWGVIEECEREGMRRGDEGVDEGNMRGAGKGRPWDGREIEDGEREGR